LVETLDWKDYYALRGTFRVTRKLEYGFAMLAMLLDPERRPMDTFLTYEKKPEVVNDLSEIMNILGGSIGK
jgi:hypothetical protein